MCGICGSIHFDQAPADRDGIQRMMQVMACRGPDAWGMLVQTPVAFGHLRLSIIDLDPRSNQPMTDRFGRAIVFNGEIYNYRDLRREIGSRWEFRTESDTEVILAAYHLWGPDCVRRFNGDWAFAIDDRLRHRVFLSRDRVGVKPLYYARIDNRFLFASEVRALVAAGVPGRVSRQTLVEFAKRGKNEPGQRTLVDQCHALLPAHNLVVHDDGRIEESEYWSESDIFAAAVPHDFPEATRRYRSLLEDSVRLRLHADVPVGVCLSGGLDSSLITAIASQISAESVRTFSGVASEYGSDEGPFSDLVADAHGTRHTRIPLDFDGFVDGLKRYVIAQEAPAGGVSPLARMLVLERAAEDVTVLLDGQGGDEILAGYYRYHVAYREAWPDRPLAMEPRVDREKSRHRPLSEFEPDFLRDSLPPPADLPSLERCVDPITRMQYESLRGPGLLSLLHTEDRLTMARSLEGRVPLLDHRLIEFCFSAPLQFRIDGVDKRLSRAAARHEGLLPEAVVDRRDKQGFATPYADMLCEIASRQAVEDLIRHLVRQTPGIFGTSVLVSLLDEHAEGAVDNSKRLFRAITTLIFLGEMNYQVV